MPRAKKHSAEEIIPKLRAAELEIAKGQWRKTDGSPAGYNAWHTHFG